MLLQFFLGSGDWDLYHQEPPTSRFSPPPPGVGGGGHGRGVGGTLLVSENTHSLQTLISQMIFVSALRLLCFSKGLDSFFFSPFTFLP